MSDVRVILRFRNDLLQQFVDESAMPLWKLAKAAKVPVAWLMMIKSMTRSPYGKRRIGEVPEYSEYSKKLSRYFKVIPEVLFPEDLYSIK